MLVATDVAARGLDVNNVDLVVHWDVPQDSETYLHRSGRTGRAGNKGTAIMMIGQRDKGRVADIIRSVPSMFLCLLLRCKATTICRCKQWLLNFYCFCMQGRKGRSRSGWSTNSTGCS